MAQCTEMFHTGPLRGARVLVVDDEQLTVRAIERVLTACGARVVSCSGVPEALEAIQEASLPFDAAVVDYWLLDREGLEVLEALRMGRYPCCALMITGRSSQDVGREAIRAGADHFLIKPFEVTEFVRVLEETVERTRVWRHHLRTTPNNPHSMSAPPFLEADPVAHLRAGMPAPAKAEASRPDLELSAERLGERGKLSDREKETLVLLLRGHKNVDISADLGITARTVKFHVKNVFKKLGVRDRSELTSLLFN